MLDIRGLVHKPIASADCWFPKALSSVPGEAKEEISVESVGMTAEKESCCSGISVHKKEGKCA